MRLQILQPHVSNLSAVFASGSIEIAFNNTAGPQEIASLFFWGGTERNVVMRHILNVGILLGMVAILVTSGCSTTGSGVSDSDQITALLGQWKAGILAADADTIMATYSENFAHDGYEYDAEDKAALREYIEGSIAQGGFDGVALDMEDVDIAIEEGAATAYPIGYTVAEGTITIELILTKEKADWLITDMVIEGL